MQQLRKTSECLPRRANSGPDVGRHREVTFEHGSESCRLLLYEGAEPAALSAALAARFRLDGVSFYLTEPNHGVVVPLSSSLPPSFQTLLVHSVASHNHVPTRPQRFRPRAETEHLPRPAMDSADSFEDEGRAWRRNLRQSILLKRGRTGLMSSSLDDLGQRKASKDDLLQPLLKPVQENRQLSPGHEVVGADATSRGRESDDDHEVCRDLPNRAASRVTDILSQAESVGEEAAEIMAEAAVAMEESVDRFSRLSADLANERTLLAWDRTCLASIRTAFAFLSVTAVSTWGQASVIFTTLAMAIAVWLGAVSGMHRYWQIKKAILTKEPQKSFGRISNHWFNGMVMASAFVVGFGIFTRDWIKG